MTQQRLLDQLVDQYYSSRPNLETTNAPLCIFFLACSGAGKSTMRKHFVEQLGMTYVCNDEVRLLLDQYPTAVESGIELKHIIAKTWDKILAEAPNKSVIFDNNIIKYYLHDDSYINVAIRLKVPVFVIDLQAPEATLKDRIVARNINTKQILADLPAQLVDYDNATMDIAADWTLVSPPNETELGYLTAELAKRSKSSR